MQQGYKILDRQDVSYLDDILLCNGLLQVVPAKTFEKIPTNHLMIFGHNYGFYCFPTTELAEWLKENFDLSTAIEIGAGHGALARYYVLNFDFRRQWHWTKYDISYFGHSTCGCKEVPFKIWKAIYGYNAELDNIIDEAIIFAKQIAQSNIKEDDFAQQYIQAFYDSQN
jgi:hypothetical protein